MSDPVRTLSNSFGGEAADKLPVGHVVARNGFVDVFLPISEVTQDRDGSITIVARGEINGAIVGLIVDILPGSSRQDLEALGLKFCLVEAKYRSLGEESDQFVALLTQYFGSKKKPAPMLSCIAATAIGLLGDPASVLTMAVKMKFVFMDECGQDCAEIFTIVDIPNLRLEVREKDPGRRDRLLQAFTGDL